MAASDQNPKWLEKQMDVPDVQTKAPVPAERQKKKIQLLLKSPRNFPVSKRSFLSSLVKVESAKAPCQPKLLLVLHKMRISMLDYLMLISADQVSQE